MDNYITVNGIETNNLKKIDIKLKKHAINLIIGPSGSGKTSLAYETIGQIGQLEYKRMFEDSVAEPNYKVSEYKNMVVTVPIKQINNNTNVRSSIATYFGYSRSIAMIYADYFNMDESDFILNRPENICEECKGLGYIKKLDELKIINYDIPLKDNPVKCWNKNKDFYKSIIKEFCKEKSIDVGLTFRELSEQDKNLLLYGVSDEKYKIKYKNSNLISTRTTKYYGAMTGIKILPNFNPNKEYLTDFPCGKCKGGKYASEIEKFKIMNISISGFGSMKFNYLVNYVNKFIKVSNDVNMCIYLENMKRFLLKAIELHLGHLSFNRIIPTLSGGELQRLRMVKVLDTQLTNMLIILDEPLVSLSNIEKKIVVDNILYLSKKNTLIVVDHSDEFINISDNIIALGEKGGKYGGELINVDDYIVSQKIKLYNNRFKIANFENILINKSIYEYRGVSLTIAKKGMNLLIGSSGVGKSTILKEYLPMFFSQYEYINQKSLKGNKNSTLSTYLNIHNDIVDLFAKFYHKEKSYFSNTSMSIGSCKACKGAGYIEYDNGYDDKVTMICKSCNGSRFDKKLDKYKIDNLSIAEVFNLTIDEGIDYFAFKSERIKNVLLDLSNIFLGHLRLGQYISTLSGGENIRVKTMKALRSKVEVIGIDEPFKGLNNIEIISVIELITEIKNKGKTIVVVDHHTDIEQYFDYINEIKNTDGILKGYTLK